MFSHLLTEHDITPSLATSPDVATNLSFNMINEQGKSIMTVVGTANQSLTAREVYSHASERLPKSSYLFLGGCFKLKKLMPAFVELAKEAKTAGVRVVLDHNRINSGVTAAEKELVRQLALHADFYLPSADEFMQLWGVSSIEEGLRLLADKSEGTIIVKNSDQGVITIIDGKIVAVPAFKVTPIHTVGAGDSFDAGVIAAQYHGKNLIESMQFGCATAALKISSESLPTYEQVITFIDAHS
jgi:sugar/nucleoside kinase (ribokinase family)